MAKHNPEEDRRRKEREEQERKRLAGESFATEPKTVLVDIAELRREVRGKTEEQQAIEQGVPGIERTIAGQAALPQLEEAGAFEEVRVRDIDLKAPKSIVGELPFIGSSIQAIGAALGQSRALKPFKGGKGVTGETAFPEPIDPETLRETALRQIRIDSFNEGISIGESMGTIIEGIPVLSSLSAKFASNLVEDPSSNAENINSEISKHAQRATNLREKAT